MSRGPSRRDRQAIESAARVFLGLPPMAQAALAAVLVAGVLAYLVMTRPAIAPAPTAPTAGATGANPDGSGAYLFCWWNVENLFDDRDDRRRSVDEEYDNAFASDAHLPELKLSRIAEAALRLNDGRGPDILAVCEVEGARAVELLKDALNARLPDPAQHYNQVAVRDLDAGRHITPAVLSRLPLDQSVTRLLGSRLRVLQTRVEVNGHGLWLVASHWTSQLRQRDGSDGDEGRAKYAALIYQRYAELVKTDPATDFLVCGDFNDTPESDPVVNDLRATGDRAAVTPTASPPRLLDLLAGKPADHFGTLTYNGKPRIYDHICVSAGLLDVTGWSCDPDSVRTVSNGLLRPGAKRREPWRFGNPQPAVPDAQRGYSDHLPVTVGLTVAPPATDGR